MTPARAGAVVAALVMLLLTTPVRAEPSASALDHEPCATVSFASGWEIDVTGHRQRVVAIATLRDGREFEGAFPYDFSYADPARDNRLFGANVYRSDRPFRVQRPPRSLDPRTLPPVIAYVLKHSDNNGYVHVRACPPLSGAADLTFSERIWKHQVHLKAAHATDDGLVVQITFEHGAAPLTVCALPLNIGTTAIERVRLRWDFTLRSGTVTRSQDWRVSLAPSASPVGRDGWADAFGAMASKGPKSCAPIADDPSLKNHVNDIAQVSLTVLGVERVP